MFEFKHPDYYKKLRKNLTNKDNYDKENHGLLKILKKINQLFMAIISLKAHGW